METIIMKLIPEEMEALLKGESIARVESTECDECGAEKCFEIQMEVERRIK